MADPILDYEVTSLMLALPKAGIVSRRSPNRKHGGRKSMVTARSLNLRSRRSTTSILLCLGIWLLTSTVALGQQTLQTFCPIKHQGSKHAHCPRVPTSPGCGDCQDGECVPGDPIDPWYTPYGQASGTFTPPIPMDWFGSGSEPFSGPVSYVGVPLGNTEFGYFGNADTLVRRTGGPFGNGDPFVRCDPPSPAVVEVEIEIVALSLKNVEPIEVVFDGEACVELWDVAVDLSVVPAPLGLLTAEKTYCNGGTFDSTFYLQPRFTFTRQVGTVCSDDPDDEKVFDTGKEGFDPIFFEMVAGCWVHDVDPILDVPVGPVCTDFHPGLVDDPLPACEIEFDCNGNGVADECDISRGTSNDIDADGIPDECQAGTTVVTIGCPDGQTGCTGTANCTVRITPTTEPIADCGGGSCEPSFGSRCYAEITNVNLLTPENLAASLEAALQSEIDNHNCNDQGVGLLSVKAIGARLIFTTLDGPAPIACLTVPGYSGILGGLNHCEADGCTFHFRVGLGPGDVLPPIPPGTDWFATVKDCQTVPGLGSWTTFDFPEGFFNRTETDVFPSKEMLDVQIALAGVARDFAVEDSDTAVERLNEVVFGRCSGDFTRPDGPPYQHLPDGVVDVLDATAFDDCMQNPIGDCDFFDYDGDGDIDENDRFVFECLLFTGNNAQCCPPNRNVPQGASNLSTTQLTRLHLRACDLLEVQRVGQNDWPEEWSIDIYLSEQQPNPFGAIGECEEVDNEPNNVMEEAEDLGILAVGEPKQIAGSISAVDCDPFVPPPAFAGSFDADVYRFSVAFEDRVNARIAAASDTTGCAGGPFGIHALYLYDADGGLVVSDKGGFVGEGKEEEQIDPSISVNVPPGEYFLVVAAAGQVRDPDPTHPTCSVLPPGQPFDGSRDPTGDYELNLAIAVRSTINVTQTVFDEDTLYGAGTFDSRLLLQPLLAFTKVCDPFHAILLDTGNEEEEALILESQGVSWVNQITDESLVGVILPGDPNFVPGVGDIGNGQETEGIQYVDPSGGAFMHRMEPPRAPKCETLEGDCFYTQLPDDDQTLDAVSAVVNPLQSFPLADSFMLSQDTDIGSITFWTTPAGAVTDEHVFGVQVLGDGPLEGGCNGPDVTHVLTDGVIGGPFVTPTASTDMDRVTINVDSFTAQADTKYWVVLAWNSEEPPSDTQPLFVTSLAGDGEFYHDLSPGAIGTGQGCIDPPDGDGWDCRTTQDDPATNCDEFKPDGDLRVEGDIALCVGPVFTPFATQLPWDVACGQWRTMDSAIVWTQPFAVREDGVVGFFSDLASPAGPGGRQAADSVTFFEEVTVTGIHWRGAYTTNTPAEFDQFRIEFHSTDSNNLPDSLEFFFVPNPSTLARVAGQLTGDPGSQIYDYWFTFPSSVVLEAEETEWISIVNDTTGQVYQWLFATAAGGDSDGRAAHRDIEDGQGGPGSWQEVGPPLDPPTDFSFDLTVEGTTKIICGDSIDCEVMGMESTASGLGYRFDSHFCNINGFQFEQDNPDSATRFRAVSAPWSFFDQIDVTTPVSPDQAGDAFIEAGIGITPQEVECLIQDVPGNRLAIAVFAGLADYEGTAARGSIDRLCNGAVAERADPNDALNERLRVKGICWDNQTVTFLTHPADPGECESAPTPQIVHADGPNVLTTPCTGYVDPRLEVTTQPPIQPAGVQEVFVKFNTEVFQSDGVSCVEVEDFTLTECLGGDPPVIDVVEYVDDDWSYVRVHWDRPITLKRWTTLKANVFNCERVPIRDEGDLGDDTPEPDRVDYAALPGDIDQSGGVAVLDLLRLIQFARGACDEACPDCGGVDYYFDIDRDGFPGQAADLLVMRQILLGVPPATREWLGETLDCLQP